MLADRDGLADFDRLNPAYFRSLDRKMRHLADQGFVPFLETVRRDCAPSWKAYFDFNASYARYVQYLIARYGAFDLVFSGIHLDWIPKDYSLTADEFNAALTYHHAKYGPLPFGQPYTTLIDRSTYKAFGHGERCPWLTMHTVGNKPRNHAIYASLEEIFRLSPPYPAANLEPYYTGWNHEINRPGGETPAPDSDRDNYFARAQMYGSVLSGGLAGHVHGTAAYDVTSTGEPARLAPVHLGRAALRVRRPDAAPAALRAVRGRPLPAARARLRRPRPAQRPGGHRRRPRRLGLHDAHRRPRAGPAVLRAKGGRSAGGRAHARRALPMDVVRHANGTLDRREGSSPREPTACSQPRRFRTAALDPRRTGPPG